MNRENTTIAIVANTTWNIYNFRLNVIKELLAQGYKVMVIAPVDKYIHYTKQFKDVTHIPLKELSRNGINPIQELKLGYELYKIYKRTSPSVILHYTVKPNLYGAIAAYLNGIPSFASVTGLGYAFIHNGYVEWITKLLYRITSRFHQKIIFENIDDRLLFINENLIRSEQGISIKGCGVDVDYYSPPEKASFPKDKIVFTFIGRLLYDKGVKEFVEAGKIIRSKHKNVEFCLLGEIDDKNPAAVSKSELMDWVKEDLVIYQGAVNDVRPFILQSHCIVLPSYREAIARSITEGMAMGKPVITTDTPGCREAVNDGVNGFIVPIKNTEKLAEAMEKIISMSSEDLIQMGRNGRQKALEEFDDKAIAKEIVNIINTAV